MEVYFKPSDIVWVKLGPFWWPGEVVDKTKVPEEVTESLKKEPVAIVKFFDDDEYFECVKTSDYIYHYNCDRKNGFIKKGMDAFRAKNPKLASFPKDVSTAEVKTGGNANILSDPLFSPERKRNYAAEIFGSPSPKKPKNSNKNRPKKSAPIITHRRFLGYDDYEAHVLIQFPGKDTESEGQDQTAPISDQPFAKFTCPICQFVTDKLGILTVHTQCHIKDVAHIPGSSMKKTPKRKRKKGMSDEESSGDVKKTKTKRKPKKKTKADESTLADDENSGNDTTVADNGISKRKIELTTEEKKDVCNDIIADWDDESNQDTTEEIDASVLDSTINETLTSIEIAVTETTFTADSALDSTFEHTEEDKSNLIIIDKENQTEILEKIGEKKSMEEKKEKDTSISCFDFDENEEDTRIPNATSGRKIPRVIPLSDKRKSFNFDDDLVQDEEEEIKKKILNDSIQLGKVNETEEKDKETEELERTYKSLMDSTLQIELPEVPNILKSEQNFHCAKTVKYPDKSHDATSYSTDGEIVQNDTQSTLDIKGDPKNNPETSEIGGAPNIKISIDGSKHSKVIHHVTLSNEQLRELPVNVSDVCSISDSKPEEKKEKSKIDDDDPVMKVKSRKLKEQHEEKVDDEEKALNITSSNKRKSMRLKELPEVSTSPKDISEERLEKLNIVEEVIGSRKKRSKKFIEYFDDLGKTSGGNSTNVKNTPVPENKYNEMSNQPDKMEQTKCEKVDVHDKKNKTTSKKEYVKKKKTKKAKKSVYKRHIDESEIDKLLAKYSVEPIVDDDESDYCSSEIVTLKEVLADSSAIILSESSEVDVSEKSEEKKQVTSSKESEFDRSEENVTKVVVKNTTPEKKSSSSEISAAGRSKQIEEKLEDSQFNLSIKPADVDNLNNFKIIQNSVEEQVEQVPEMLSIEPVISDAARKQIGTEVELKEEAGTEKQNNTKTVSPKQKTSRRSSKRHKGSSKNIQQEEHEVTPLIHSERKTEDEVDENKHKEKYLEYDSNHTASNNSPQVSESATAAEFSHERSLNRDVKTKAEVHASFSLASSETSRVVVTAEKDTQRSVKRERTTSKEHKKESSHYRPFSDGKKETDATISSRRSTRRDRKSADSDDVRHGQATIGDSKEKLNIEIISHNISKRDYPNKSGKEKNFEKTDSLQIDTIAVDPEEIPSGSSRNSKKSDSNGKVEQHISKNESPRNVEQNVCSRKESHRSPHKDSKSYKKSSRTFCENKSSSGKKDSVEDDQFATDQILQPIVSHRSSRSKSHHTDHDTCKKDEHNVLSITNEYIDVGSSSNESFKNIRSNKSEHQLLAFDKQKEKQISTSQKEDRKSSQTSRGRRSSKHDNEYHESSKESVVAQNESSKMDDKKKISSHRHSKSDRQSNKDKDESSNNRVIQSDAKEELLEVNQGSSIHRTYRRSKDHGEKSKNDSLQSEKVPAQNEREVKASSVRCYRSDRNSKKERQDKSKHSSTIEPAEKDREGCGHRTYKKDIKLRDESGETQNDPTVNEKGDISYSTQKADETLSNWSSKRENESKKSKEKKAEFKVSPVHQEEQKPLPNIDQIDEDKAEKKQTESDEKKDETVHLKNQSEENAESNISLNRKDGDELEITAKLEPIQAKEIISYEKASTSGILDIDQNTDMPSAKNQKSIEVGSFSPISGGDQDLTNLISAIVGADSTLEFDQIKKSDNIEQLFDPVSDNSSNLLSCCDHTKEKEYSNDGVDQLTSASESLPKININQITEMQPLTSSISSDRPEAIADRKQEISIPASQSSRRNRKPSRWDQKERPNTAFDKKPRISRWDQGNKDYIDEQKSNISDIIENADTTNKIESSSNTPHSESDHNLVIEKLDDKTVSLNEEPSTVSQSEAEQIELIFGSSPLPKPNDDNLFTEEEENKKLQEADIDDSVQKKDSKRNFITKSKPLEPTTISEAKNKETSIFECSTVHLPIESSSEDLMESVESQVARITHYEEPSSEEGCNDYKVQSRKESLFDTPDKVRKFSTSIFDIPEGNMTIDSESSENKFPIDSKKPQLLETDLGMQKHETIEEQRKQDTISPKSKKNYLLVEKSKLEKIEKSPETLKDPLHSQPSSSKSITEKISVVNEVATRLTNPKKRFVKSFEDFELNKQKEKSVDTSTAVEDKRTKTVSGLVGKSPIVFKLKKQFLSKISNVFDEENEDLNKGINSTIKSKPSTIVPSISPKIKGLNLLMKSESNMNVSKSDSLQCLSKKETEAEIVEKPDVLGESTLPDNLELVSNKSLLEDLHNIEDLHKIEDPEIKSMEHKEIDAVDIQNKESQIIEENTMPQSTSHQLHFAADNNSPVEFIIDTNLSNIDKPEELNEFASLVDLPVLQSELEKKMEEEAHDDSKTEIITKNFPLECKKDEPEFVPIDGNLTVVSEKELEEGQVEIMASMSNKRPVTLMNFSMDFSDDSSDTSFEVLKKENIRCITESLDVSKNSEDEIKDNEDKKTQHLVELTSNEATSTSKIHVEKTFQSTIIDQFDLNFHNDTVIQKEYQDDTNITIENVLDTKELKKNEPADNPLSTDSLSKMDETPTLLKAVNRVSDSISTRELEKVESASPTKRSERKSSQKAKVTVPPINEPMVIYNTVKSSTITDMCDLEDHIPSQIVCTKNALINEKVMKVAGIGNELTKQGSLPKIEPPISKLLSRLTSEKTEDDTHKSKIADIDSKKLESDIKNLKKETGVAKSPLKSAIKGKTTPAQTLVGVTSTKSGNKAIILSEKIIRPARDAASSNPQMKRSYEDVEDIKSYIITKNQKIDIRKGSEKPMTAVTKLIAAPSMKSPSSTPSKLLLTNPSKPTGVPKFSGKAKILNQTIIRPAGEILQAKAVSSLEDNVDFDINSMPIVISDELLTPESLENMPIVLGDNISKTSATEKLKIIVEKKEPHSTAKILNNSVTMPSLVNSPTLKMPQLKKAPIPKILQTPGQSQKIIRQPVTKPGKYIILPENPNKSVQMMKKPNIVRRSTPISGVTTSPHNITPETTGHKIMIVTNQQGQQQRLLLTPAHQKMFGMQLPKAGKTMVKSAITQKTSVGKIQTTIPTNMTSTSKVQGQVVSSPKFIKAPVSSGQVLSPQLKLAPPRKVQKVYMPSQQTVKAPQQKTILIRNQHGQTVRKIQGTDDALLDKQVAEQLEAIKVSSLKSQQRQQESTFKAAGVNKPGAITTRKAYSKRPEVKNTAITQPKLSMQSTSTNVNVSKSPEGSIPPLTPIKLDKKSEEPQKQISEVKPIENKPLDRPLNQLVIQDNMGNQTTVTEGQILALPSETVDGQPQSYMLVTLDEAGNLTPLNNEALMSLDPSLAGLTGGDLSNMVLQLDPGITKDGGSHTAQLQAIAPVTQAREKLKPEGEASKIVHQEATPKPIEQIAQPVEQTTTQVQVTCNINGEPSQQIILTGDPLATQKFLDSLSEGNTDLANILANAEGNSFLIQADGQQILINTEPTDAQMLQANTNVAEQPEQGNPMFATHPLKNQDILAAALADTDVFQQEQVSNQNKIMHSQLSPGQTLFPMNVGNVLETSLTLNSPIMTPLEVPSINSKKITDAEADILTARVPKNVDLPITITDPNISQTVSHQQVLMASDLQTNLELTLPISETAMSVTSGMNSPSFVYSLPNLDVAEHTEVSQKSFSSSMPLLTEDMEETAPLSSAAVSKEGSKCVDNPLSVVEMSKHTLVESLSGGSPGIITSDGTFIEEGLCTLGGEMCSSLSEPPPEMFDIPISNDGLNFLTNKAESACRDKSNTSISLAPELLTDENSIEIPVQPQIVADLKDPPHTEETSNSVTKEKECKLD